MLDQSSRSFSPDDLAMLSAVLRDVIISKVDDRPVSDAEMRELSTRLGKLIMDHFTAGERDPERLKKVALNGHLTADVSSDSGRMA